jgi:hypothetical protein
VYARGGAPKLLHKKVCMTEYESVEVYLKLESCLVGRCNRNRVVMSLKRREELSYTT